MPAKLICANLTCVTPHLRLAAVPAATAVPVGHFAPTAPGRPEAPAGPGGGTGTGLLEREEVREQRVDDGDHERFAHYVRKEKIMESAVTGRPVIALCGKVWVPGRDPDKYPICPTCKEIYDGLRKPNDGGDGSGKDKPAK